MRRRVGRGALVAALACSLALFAVLAIAAAALQHPGVLRRPLRPDDDLYLISAGIAVSLAAILAVAMDLKRPIGSRLLVAFGILAIAGFVALAWDDSAVRHPSSMDSLSPARAGDEATFALFLRYAKGSPAAAAIGPPKLQLPASQFAKNPDARAAFLQTHRSEIEAEWAALLPVRVWWDELAALPRIGDLTPPDPAAAIPAFLPIRLHAQLAVAVAGLQALDGHGDEALAAVTRIYAVARKLEPSSRTLVRAMIAKNVQTLALQGAGFVLDRASVSPAARAVLAAELDAAVSGDAGARHLALVEYGFSESLVTRFRHGFPADETPGMFVFHRVVRVAGPVVLNPRATANLFGDHFHAVARLASARRLSELEDPNHPVNRSRLADFSPKNLGGRILVTAATPGLAKVMRVHWETDDLRLACLKRLQSM